MVLFRVAQKLGGMTVDELASRIRLSEVHEWVEILREEDEHYAELKAKAGRR